MCKVDLENQNKEESLKKQKNDYIDDLMNNFIKLSNCERLTKICANFINQNLDFEYDYFINGNIYANKRQQKPYIETEDIQYKEQYEILNKAIKVSNNLFIRKKVIWKEIQNIKSKKYADIVKEKQYNEMLQDKNISKIFKHIKAPQNDFLYDYLIEKFEDFIKFRDILIESGHLNDNKLELETFYLLIWFIREELFKKSHEDLKKMYDINFNTEENFVIDQLIEKGVDKTSINVAISLHEYIEQNEQNYHYFIDKNNELIDNRIRFYKNKKYLDDLEANVSKKKVTIEEIDLMSGIEFEDLICDLFKKLGYLTERTRATGDQGIDIIARKNEYIVAIQAKRYNSVVGNHAVMEAVAGMKYYKANKCMVITNSNFTKSAKELAIANNVELWDRARLQENLKDI